MAVGGAQRVLLDQADWFHAHGHKVTAAFFYDRDNLQKTWQTNRPFTIYNLEAFKQGAGSLYQIAPFLQGLFRLWKLLRTEQFDVIETFTLHSNIPGMILSWMAGIPVRMASHHGKVGNVSQLQERLHLLVIAGFASVVVAVSREVYDHLVSSRIDRNRIVLIQNGINPPNLNPKDQTELRLELALRKDQIVLISVGRLVYQKAHNVLVNAMSNIIEQKPQVILYIAGEGLLRRDLEKQISDLGLANRIYLLGNRNDVSALLSIADIFVLPSRWEGLSMALLEAMGSGLPVIATQVEGVNEVIQQNIQGLLVPADDAEALTEALLQLINNPELRLKMGQAARKRIEESYTTNLMCEKYMKAMQEPFKSESTEENK